MNPRISFAPGRGDARIAYTVLGDSSPQKPRIVVSGGLMFGCYQFKFSRPEIVGFLPAECFTSVETDTDLQSFSVNWSARRLLHRDGAAYGGCGRGEGIHHAVALPFHLLSAVGLRGLAEELVVRLEDALRPLVAETAEQLRRVDEVCIEKCCGR